jgi:hypothetical protein
MDEPRSSSGQAGFLITNNPRGRCARGKFLHLAAAALALCTEEVIAGLWEWPVVAGTAAVIAADRISWLGVPSESMAPPDFFSGPERNRRCRPTPFLRPRPR